MSVAGYERLKNNEEEQTFSCVNIPTVHTNIT